MMPETRPSLRVPWRSPGNLTPGGCRASGCPSQGGPAASGCPDTKQENTDAQDVQSEDG